MRTRAAVAAGIAVVVMGLSGCNGEQPVEVVRAAATDGKLPWRGADISFTLQEEAAKRAVHLGGETLPMERLLARSGANLVRLRVWVDPPPGYSDETATLALARRAKAAGLGVLLDLHYSDTWADHTFQQIPKRWRDLDETQLRAAVQEYTRHLVASLGLQGTPPVFVQVGNEVGKGMLWPTGSVDRPDGKGWDTFAELASAAVQGVKDGASGLSTPPRIVLHTATGADAAGTGRLVQELADRGVDFDVIGLSYYPFWQGSLDALSRALDELSRRFDLDLMVVETAYPWTLADDDDEPNVVTKESQLPDADRFPPTKQGQADFFEALRAVIAAVPGGHGLGFLAWEPGWRTGVGWRPGAGSQYDNLTMVDHDGEALPSLGSLRP